MTIKEKILLESKVWTLEKRTVDAHYFENLTRQIKPTVLWIDSSDNLVSVRELTNTDPGEVLVHRNMASQVRSDDMSLMATLEHALNIVHVEVIIVCGFSHCSGIRDVILGTDKQPHLRKWFEDLSDLYEGHSQEMTKLNIRQKEKFLSELNIQRQILNLSNLELVQRAWDKGKPLVLLGWYFDLYKGAIQEIFSMQERDLLTHVSPVA